MRNFLRYLIPAIFLVVFLIIISIMIIFDDAGFGADFLFTRNISLLVLRNIVALLIGLIFYLGFLFLIYKIKPKKKITKKQFFIGIVITLLITYIIQLIIIYFAYFFTKWDVSHLLDIANQKIQTGEVSESDWWLSRYITVFPNNNVLLAILVFIKSIPILGVHHLFLLAINALLVNTAGFLTLLTIYRISSSKKLVAFAFCFLLPILFLNPWMIIPYSDTFALIFPIAVLLLYTSKNKKIWHYLLIGFLSFFGFFIKPTVLIVLVAIILIEILHVLIQKPFLKSFKKNVKKITIASCALLTGVLLAFSTSKACASILNIKIYDDVYQITLSHYLAMGQNNETYGAHSGQDQGDAQTYGPEYEWNKFINRISTRTPFQQLGFTAKKLFLTYSDGTFGWGQEGGFFYQIPEKNNSITNFLRNIYYDSGSAYPFWVQCMQIVWITIIFGCIFIIRRKNSKVETVIMASLIGLTIFQLLFETRSRYLFCYLPIFIICATLGYNHIKDLIIYLHQRLSQ